MSGQNWNERYTTGDTPWDSDAPDRNLVDAVSQTPIAPCDVLEIGCGSGSNAVWLSQQQFAVTAVDVAEAAIAQCKERAIRDGISATFLVADFLSKPARSKPFGFVFDRGCFHSFAEYEERRDFADRVAEHLEKNGLWLSLIGSADDAPRETGPPALSASEITRAVEKRFEILSLTTCFFEANPDHQPRAWCCLMKKR